MSHHKKHNSKETTWFETNIHNVAWFIGKINGFLTGCFYINLTDVSPMERGFTQGFENAFSMYGN